MADSPSDDTLHSLQFYQAFVQEYEKLDEEIDDLIMANGGKSEKMPVEARTKYRELARRRDDVLNEMRRLEQRLRLDG